MVVGVKLRLLSQHIDDSIRLTCTNRILEKCTICNTYVLFMHVREIVKAD